MGSTSDLLVLDWCSRDTAAALVQRYHYAKTLPQHLYRIGVWEGGYLIGCVVFARCKPSTLRAHALDDNSCEVIRIALGPHQTPASRILRIAVALLRQRWPELRVIVAHCDPKRGHVGVMYQAAGWTYAGCLSYAGCKPKHCYLKHAGKAETSAASGRTDTPDPIGRCNSDLPAPSSERLTR